MNKIVSLTLAALLANGTAHAQAPAPYHFSPVNQYDISLTAAYWNPIISYVSEKSGVPMVLKIGRTSADTTAYVLAREVEFVFTNHLFSPEREKLGWKVIGRRQTPPVHGDIVVLDSSPIRKIEELQNMEVAFPGPEALVGYKFTYAHLLSKGVQPKVVFGGNQNGAMGQLVAGKVQAVGGNSQLIEGYAAREKQKFRVLWRSEPLYDLALMVSGKVPEQHVKAVSAAFFGMHKDPRGKAILQQASERVGLRGDAWFIPSDGSEYSAYRRFYQTAPASLH
ncbi:MAG: phosphate/phosphite/phosphonate ABC transporter substrate-binding protein [Burkholderiaceae bacterium]|nr:phosphate/phosphite/phosphonate ABC transporter substrate-binding protein [Burkholderiaceae bacterium]